MWKTILLYFGGVIVTVVLLVALIVLVHFYVPHGVLPSRHAMTHMPPMELEAILLKTTPLGSTRADVEKALRQTYGKPWQKRSTGVEYLSNMGFHVPVSEGDYHLESTFAADFDLFPKRTFVSFLFDQEDRLKDVVVENIKDTL